MKSYHQKFISDHPYESVPMAEISGFPVRPGIYDLNGATPLQNGVNFTIHTCGGTSCELPQEQTWQVPAVFPIRQT